ncbi:GNAT family N-acetyltransferase [Arenimonas aestuarii]
MPHPLDNPVFESLAHRHRPLALQQGGVLRYPSEIAPFLGVPDAGHDDPEALHALVPPGDTVLMLGKMATPPVGWIFEPQAALVQMACPEPLAEVEGPEVIELGDAHHADILELVALVYPHYFRPQATRLGRYFGIYQQGRLAAIAGERMGPPGHREVSAVCTHPDFLGRGYSRRLMALLSNDLLRHGLVPFLHVSPANDRALALYERIGYQHRARIAFASLSRPDGMGKPA